MSENIHRGEFLRQSQFIQDLNVPAIDAIRELYQRGVTSGVFRRDWTRSTSTPRSRRCRFFNVSNRHSFGLIFQARHHLARLPGPAARQRTIDMVWRHLRS